MFQETWKTLSRKKTLEAGHQLVRCLTVVDCTCLGLATTLGTGIYVLIPEAARKCAGPSVVLSVLLASVTSCLSGLCYNEVSSRFTNGGSAYTFAYAITGEFWAFLVGWAMILDYTLGAALAAKACTQYLDIALNGSISGLFKEPFGRLFVTGLDKYFDVPAATVIIFIIFLIMAMRIKVLCCFNNIFVIVNIMVIFGTFSVGIFNMDAENWTAGAGFFPNGVSGVFSAAALCYFTFVGYDTMATHSVITKHHAHVLPMATSFVFLVGLLSTFSAAIALTLLVPSSLLDSTAPLMQAFILRSIVGMQYFIAVGAVTGFISATTSSLLASVRLLNSFADDGLLFSFLSRKEARNEKNFNFTSLLLVCIVTSIIALLCDTSTLIYVMGMGTLTACTSVAVSVMCLRYSVPERRPLEVNQLSRESTATFSSGSRYYPNHEDIGTQTHACQEYLIKEQCDCTQQMSKPCTYGSIHQRSVSVAFVNDSTVTCLSDFSPHWNKKMPNQNTAATVIGVTTAMIITVLLMGVMTLRIPQIIGGSVWWLEVLSSSLFVIILICVVIICYQPTHRSQQHNRIPCVPILPLFAIWMNVHLISGLPYTSWLVFIIWTLLGTVLYFTYGVWHSKERRTASNENINLLLNTSETNDNINNDNLQQETN